MKRVLYVSGTRADYGPARQILKKIDQSDLFELEVLVTGMHLDPQHGETWRELVEDGFAIADKVPGRVVGDTLSAMASSVGLYLYGISNALERLQPDIVVVLGDRGEMLAAALAAAYQNIPVVHLCGGSISGSIDDSIRHAITKMAHYHIVATDDHAKRVAQMGENPERILIAGIPGADLTQDVQYTKNQVCAMYELPADKPYVLVIQHAVTHSCEDAKRQIVETLEAVSQVGLNVLLANPNDDAGGRIIQTEMNRYSNQFPLLKIVEPPGSREIFASLMAHASVLVGNSSCGTVEAMSIPLPVVNIGDRQRGRESTSCMLNVNYDRVEILAAIEEVLHGGPYVGTLNLFESSLIDKDGPEKILGLLESVDKSVALDPKHFYDI